MDLASDWRSRADQLKAYGAAAQALVLEKCAEDLERSVGEWQSELLNLIEAAAVSGYSADHLGRLVRDGKIPNRGRPGAPKIARGDLPMRRQPPAETVAPGSAVREISRTAIVQSIIDKGVA